MSVYHTYLDNLLKASTQYRNGVLGIEEYRKLIWYTACEVVSLEEKELRQFLQQAEAEIDSICFTVNEKDVFQESLKVVGRIENLLTNQLKGTFYN